MVLIRSGPTTGKRGVVANREPVQEEVSRACTMRTILEGERIRGGCLARLAAHFWRVCPDLGARVAAKPLHVPLSRQLAKWLIRGIIFANREFLGRDAGSANTCL